MITTKRFIQAAFVAFAFSLVVPVVARLAAQQRSGYVIAWGDDGTPTCTPGGSDNCNQS